MAKVLAINRGGGGGLESLIKINNRVDDYSELQSNWFQEKFKNANQIQFRIYCIKGIN